MLLDDSPIRALDYLDELLTDRLSDERDRVLPASERPVEWPAPRRPESEER